MNFVPTHTTARLNNTVELVLDMGGQGIGSISRLPWGVWEASSYGDKIGVFVTRDEAIAELLIAV